MQRRRPGTQTVCARPASALTGSERRARELPMQLSVLARGGPKRRAQLLRPAGRPEVLVVKRIANHARPVDGSQQSPAPSVLAQDSSSAPCLVA